MHEPSSPERLMAYCEVAKIINEAGVGALAVVRGIHAENTMLVSMGSYVFEFNVTGIDVPKDAEEVWQCPICQKFSLPLPFDHVGEALMAAHLSTCKG